ncbi:zinc ribbon domain-containing protein [Pseudomonas aeruginosa]|nr:zinc ribbon domain-containing protein [Pseudomonas aeruginosa]
MALIKCKECGAQVSNKAKACPSCGAKVPKSVGVIGWLFVIFIVLGDFQGSCRVSVSRCL